MAASESSDDEFTTQTKNVEKFNLKFTNCDLKDEGELETKDDVDGDDVDDPCIKKIKISNNISNYWMILIFKLKRVPLTRLTIHRCSSQISS